MKTWPTRFMVLTFATLLASCNLETDRVPDQSLEAPSTHHETSTPTPLDSGQGLSIGSGTYRPPAAPPVIIPGSTNLPLPTFHGVDAQTAANGYVLNFENVDIRDVLKSVLGDMLGAGYTVDPAVQGTLNLHTGAPLRRESVLPVFEEALKLAGVALIPGAAGYQVVPYQGAAQRSFAGGAGGLRQGYRVEVVPLHYVGAAEVQRAIEPLLGTGAVVQTDAPRNFLILAGTDTDLVRAKDAIGLFDVDTLRNQSFGLFPLQYSSAKDVADDLGSVTGKGGPMAGMVRIVPIDHINAILVVSPRLSYVTDMGSWIKRFDRGRDSTKPRLFIYHVQNGRARDLASVLTRVIGRGQTGSTSSLPQDVQQDVAPFTSGGAGNTPQAGLGLSSSRGGGLSSAPQPVAPAPSVLLGEMPSGDNTGAGPTGSNDLRITADENNNALLIVTTPERYTDVEAALVQLDRVPLQVLLEASIAEVNLTDQLSYGVQYYFQSGNFSLLRSSVAATGIAAATGGFSVAFLRAADIQAVLNLLSTITKVRVISAPKILVLNNHTASLQVGDEVPVATSSSVSTIAANAPVVNTIQLLDTGIILRATPRVNQSGLVTLDLSQEVSASVPTQSSTLNSPTIQQRRVSTTVAVQDGETIAIGGLISDNRTRSRNGIPVLKDIPYLGVLFGETTNQVTRTELIVLITPHVIRDQVGAAAATDEIRAKLPLIRNFNASNAR